MRWTLSLLITLPIQDSFVHWMFSFYIRWNYRTIISYNLTSRRWQLQGSVKRRVLAWNRVCTRKDKSTTTAPTLLTHSQLWSVSYFIPDWMYQSVKWRTTHNHVMCPLHVRLLIVSPKNFVSWTNVTLSCERTNSIRQVVATVCTGHKSSYTHRRVICEATVHYHRLLPCVIISLFSNKETT